MSDIKKQLTDLEVDSFQSAARAASYSLTAALTGAGISSAAINAIEFARFSSAIDAAKTASMVSNSSWSDSIESLSALSQDWMRAAVGPMEDFKRAAELVTSQWNTDFAKLAESMKAYTLQFAIPEVTQFRGLTAEALAVSTFGLAMPTGFTKTLEEAMAQMHSPLLKTAARSMALCCEGGAGSYKTNGCLASAAN